MDFSALGNTCVVGLQWGDEGKGKIVDVLTEHFDIVVRYNGGANAGHTVRLGDERFALHLIPSGILRPGVRNVIGPGVALDPPALVAEIDGLTARGVAVGDNLVISNRAHVVMPYHRLADRLSERSLRVDRRIGTTARGIGPCYADKMLRSAAFRVADLLRPARFREHLADVLAERDRVLSALFPDAERLSAATIADEYLACGERLRPFVADATPILLNALRRGNRILFEGAQGMLLDIDHGTFPFVTSSHCGPNGVASGAGVPPQCVRSVLGVSKAYSTRVGAGPFPTELNDETAGIIRERGQEYGTTTGRPRRCGWYDAVAARYCVALGGVTQVAIMHLDTLGSLPEVRICCGYRVEGIMLDAFVPDADVLEHVEPVFETMPGWSGDISGVRRFEDLPIAAQRYVDRLEALLDAPITLLSVGADRSDTLHRSCGLIGGA
mgnify:CR=1 FL=1